MDVEALKPGHGPAFLWFTREGKAYLVSDPAALKRVEDVAETPAPRDETLGERLRRLADELLMSGDAQKLDR